MGTTENRDLKQKTYDFRPSPDFTFCQYWLPLWETFARKPKPGAKRPRRRDYGVAAGRAW